LIPPWVLLVIQKIINLNNRGAGVL
jgi:hypothetical protein